MMIVVVLLLASMVKSLKMMESRPLPIQLSQEDQLESQGFLKKSMLGYEQFYDKLFANALIDLPLNSDLPASGSQPACFGSSKANLTILSLVIGRDPEYEKALRRNRLKLASLGGYEYCQYTESLDIKRAIVWSKILSVSALLKQGRQNVVWIDADAIMIHPKLFEDVTNYQQRTKDLIVTNDFNENGQSATPESSINFGVFLIKNCEWSIQLLRRLYYDFPESLKDWNQEQVALMSFRKKSSQEFHEHVDIIPWRTMNTCAALDDGHAFILHEAGSGGLANVTGSGMVEKYKRLSKRLADMEVQKR